MKHFCSLLFITLMMFNSYAQDFGGGYNIKETECLSREQRAIIKQRIKQNRAQLIQDGLINKNRSSSSVVLALPMKSSASFPDYNYFAISNYVDHDTDVGELTDYNCGTRSYDTESGYNHRGIDYFSWPFSWELMDNDMIEIIAAASGTIIGKDDGNDDKSCSFNSSNWNAVYIEHSDGSIAWYGHLKNGSTTSKGIGESVEVGEYLGIMGSSGNSTGPHLHLELYDANDELIDPYEGSCNPTVTSSWWNNQEEYYSATVNAVKTHDAPPEFGCYNEEDSNIENDFVVGDLVYFATYFRDQQIEHISDHKVYRPDGSVLEEWQTQSNASHYSASYWYRSFRIPSSDQPGTWSFTVDYLEEQYEHYFCVSPSRPTISMYGGDFVSSSEDGNQWFLNGEIISGATESVYTPLVDGEYTVNVTVGDCPPSELSNVLEFESEVTSVKRARNTIKITPNPTNGIIRIQNETTVPTGLIILDLSGQVIKTVSGKLSGNIDISDLLAGVYVVQVISKNEKFQQTLIKQ